jgi:NADPH:quinone reductase-like Zn-dependent oxidoreductase
MKAAYITGHGTRDSVVIGERPDPVRKPGEIVLRVRGATLNRVDLYMRDSGAGITHPLPMVLGVDGAGVVEEADPGFPEVKVGDRVLLYPAATCGRCEFCRKGEEVLCAKVSYLGENRDGTFAERVAAPALNAFPIPAGLDFVEAAALPVNYLTAWRMLFTKARVQPQETVLVFGIGGGVSLAAMQLARMIGARVIVTSRHAAKLAKCVPDTTFESVPDTTFGIDSAREDVVKRVMAITGGRGVDVVIENVGEPVWPLALKSLVRGGRIVTCGATAGDAPSADLRRLFIRQLQVFGSTLGTRHEFAALLEACSRGLFRPVIDSRYPLDQLHAALDRLESAAQFGKIGLELP